ncbi:MAG: hypothetical protein ABSA12_00795 [Verrucomicrobiia bacterium]
MNWSEHWADFKKPSYILNLILAVYSIGLTIFAYYKTQQRREISYRFVTRTKVFDSSSSSPKLRLLARDQTPITNDVYVTSIQFWNSGTMPIEPSDVRRPLSLLLVKGDILLDWTVAYCVSDPDVCKFSISAVQTNKTTSTLRLSWEHFDPGRGCQIQIMFMGDTNAAVGFTSPFSGNGEIRDANVKSNNLRLFIRKVAAGVAVSIIVVLGALFLVFFWSPKRDRPQTILLNVMVCLCALLSVAFIAELFFDRDVSTPFPPDVPINFKASP